MPIIWKVVPLVKFIANLAAHTLARWSLANGTIGSLNLGDGPPPIVNVMQDEAKLS